MGIDLASEWTDFANKLYLPAVFDDVYTMELVNNRVSARVTRGSRQMV
jgi:hypothetical protein